MRTVPVRIILQTWPTQRVQLFHTALEGGVDVAGRTLVEACVGHRHDLAFALAARDGVAGRDSQYLPRDAVAQLAWKDLLNVTDLIQRCQVGEPPHLHGETNRATGNRHIRRRDMGRLRNPFRRILRAHIAMQHDAYGLLCGIELALRVQHNGRSGDAPRHRIKIT